MSENHFEERIARIEEYLSDEEGFTAWKPDEEPTDPPEQDRTLIVEATPLEGAVRITWRAEGAEIASTIVGRNGNDSNGSGPWSTEEPQNVNARTFDKLLHRAYIFTVTARWKDGEPAMEKTVEVTPLPVKEEPTPPPIPSNGKLPLVGRSKLPFNHVFFEGGGPSDGTTFVAKYRNGRPFDGALFFTGRGSWGEIQTGLAQACSFVKQGKICVISLPHAPESEGDNMNARGAQDVYASQQKALGELIKQNGANSPLLVLRVDWEANGNWYRWSANRGGGPANLKKSLTNFIKNVKAGGADKALINVCFNAGPSQAGADFSYLPDSGVDIIGLDSYDHWGPVRNDADWAKKIAQNPGFTSVDAEAARRGIQWAVDETGPINNRTEGGGDNPFFLTKLEAYLRLKKDRVAYFNTYNHPGAPADFAHQLDANPRYAAEYKRLFG